MDLHVNGLTFKIDQMGPDFLFLGSPTNHPPTDAEIVMVVDGQETRWWVHLPDGIIADQQSTKLALRNR